MATLFGTSIDGIFDTKKTWGLVSGVTNLGNALARRLSTPRGGLFYDLSYGYDLRQFVNAAVTDQQLDVAIGQAERQCQLDERVSSVSITATRNLVNPANGTLSLTLRVATNDGPFTLILVVNSLTVELLSIEGQA